MPAEPAAPRRTRRAGVLVLIVFLIWLSCGFWNSVKPMPPGTHVTSLPARLAESQVEFIDDVRHRGLLLQRQVAAIDRAEQMIVLDQSPVARELAQHLLMRKRQRPNLKIVLGTDPRNEVYGGTPAQTLNTLERAGIIVARTRLDRLRDSNPLYSSLWRLTLGWWSDRSDEVPGKETLTSWLRRLNAKSNQRQVLVTDDGAGGWSSLIGTAGAGHAALEIRGRPAHEIAASELQIATWSSEDDRLPAAPPVEGRSVGTIDARFLTEGALHAALRDVIAASGRGDSISIAVRELGDRQVVNALLLAATRNARVQILLDPELPANQAVAAELVRNNAGNIDVRWAPGAAARYMVVRHRNDVWLNLGSADYTRRDLDDLNLECNIELHMPARAAPARAASEAFGREWAVAAVYADDADESTALYWQYRFEEATGLALF